METQRVLAEESVRSCEVRLMDMRGIEPAPSRVPSQRLMEAPQEAARDAPAQPRRAGSEPPAASERVSWWRRMFGFDQ
jgi:hypothetical protein